MKIMSTEIGRLFLDGYEVTETGYTDDGEVNYLELKKDYLDQETETRAFYVDELREEKSIFDKINFVNRSYEDVYFDSI